MRENFVKWLQAEMDRRKMSPADLAEAMGVSRATVTRILNEERGVGQVVAEKIAHALKMDPDLVLYKVGILKRDPESPTEGLDPTTLDIVQMLANRTESEKLAVRAAIAAMLENMQRGIDGRTDSRRSGNATRSNSSGS